jgi:UDP:flavonoid glycosyltransferase YjiC (YdhE family)
LTDPTGTRTAARSGDGINLRTARPSRTRLRAAIDAVLGEGDYRRNAERLRTAYRKVDAAMRSAELLEGLAGVTGATMVTPGGEV